MIRRVLLASLLAPLVACQDYNFNPVGKCIIQPGSSRIQLANVATADLLFVVDDSGSMQAEQASLARNFGSFIAALARTQAERAANGQQPFEFHIAVTTSSVFEGWQPSGAPQCKAQQTNGPLTCNVLQPTYSWKDPYSYACTTAGSDCGDLIQNYHFLGCTNGGVSTDKAPYWSGGFVANGGNPRVLHFTKDLDWGSWGTASVDPKLTALVGQFQQNINVGTCGSGMEQHFEAGRLAVEKALRQGGLSQPDVAASEWPHPGAKMVVVFLGDEDDCSSPNDPLKGLFFTADRNAPGNDVCLDDELKPAAEQKMFSVQQYADYFTSLNRPFGAAFIYSAVNCHVDPQGNTVCDPGLCSCECPPGCASCGPSATGACQLPAECSGKSTGYRFNRLSSALRAKGVATLDASVCSYDFGKTLQGIAELVKPPPGLTLPSLPADKSVSVLRIESTDGKTSRYCSGPGPGLDWSFVDCKSGAQVVDATTACIAINHDSGRCEPNPGETYIMQYLGMVPEGGCTSSDACSAKLGGSSGDWTCQKSPGQTVGTCLCSGSAG